MLILQEKAMLEAFLVGLWTLLQLMAIFKNVQISQILGVRENMQEELEATWMEELLRIVPIMEILKEPI